MKDHFLFLIDKHNILFWVWQKDNKYLNYLRKKLMPLFVQNKPIYYLRSDPSK